MSLTAGDTLLNGHYRIVRQVGRGGFGFVYLAQDTLLDEQVAIKELIPALVGDEAMLKRFLAEARATMRLRHERIVGTHNVFREGGHYYIVMECMVGGSLEAQLRERGCLAVDEAVRVAVEVCEGLAYAHERGIVHCDLKPANILFDKNGHAKVADFGIAHVSSEMLTRSWHTPAGFVAGTLPYMSPEQADGVRDDPRIDVYAMGAVLYRMLTGKVYLDFDSRETPGATADNVYRIRNKAPVSPSDHTPTVPSWLDVITLRALSKRPEERYNSVNQLQTVLLQIEHPAPPPVEVEPPTRLMADEQPMAEAEPISPAAAPRRQPKPQQADQAGSQPARLEPHASPRRSTSQPQPDSQKPISPSTRQGAHPKWFWPVAGIAGVLLVILSIAIGAVLGSGDDTETAIPTQLPTLVAAATALSEYLPAPTCEPCPQVSDPSGNILEAVRSRGKVVCGARADMAGFAYLDAEGRNVGFDIDLCRAVAVALFSDPEAVEFVYIQAAERGPALLNAEVDLMSRNVSWTSSRDTLWGNFTWITFYDGQGMMVRVDSGFTTLEDLDGAIICVTAGTTTEENLEDVFRQRGLEFTALTFEDTSAIYGAYEDGRCDAATSDRSQLAAVRRGFANPDDHFVMDITMSKDPLTPAVPHGDEQWFDVVKLTIWVLINAEELGVNSQNVDGMMSSDNVEIRRLLGVEGSFGQEDLGLATDFAANVIRTIGNYGEIYDRYMGPEGELFTLPRGPNRLWSDGGLIYAPPLR